MRTAPPEESGGAVRRSVWARSRPLRGDCASPGSASERGAPQRGGELRVFLDEGALHLLEQSELLFREWHRSSPTGQRRNVSSGSCQSRQAPAPTVGGFGKFVTGLFR